MFIIIENHQIFEKVGNRWKLKEDHGNRKISKEVYERLATEKWPGDSRSYGYTPFGKSVVKLTNIEPDYKELKSVRTFEFIKA